jgi:hypothetical protein
VAATAAGSSLANSARRSPGAAAARAGGMEPSNKAGQPACFAPAMGEEQQPKYLYLLEWASQQVVACLGGGQDDVDLEIRTWVLHFRID